MYTIKQAAARAGVSVPLMRAWERRYGVVQPARTNAGYRLYDDAAIARLREMRRLVDTGWSPSAAATRLASLPDDKLPVASSPEREPAAMEGGRFVEAFVSASGALDARRVEELLDEALSRGSFELAAERYLLPALEGLGAAWADGRIDVAAEHAASHAVLRRLSAAYQAAGRQPSGRRGVLVGLPPGARHELGALVFSVAARRAGLPVMYLGADLPVQDWVDAARRSTASGAVIGAVTEQDRDAALRVATALRAARPDILVAFAGPTAPDPTAVPGLVDGAERRTVIRLPDGVVDSVDALGRALRAGTAR